MNNPLTPEVFNQLLNDIRDDAFKFMSAEKNSIEETLFFLSLAIRTSQAEREYAKIYRETGEIKHETTQ